MINVIKELYSLMQCNDALVSFSAHSSSSFISSQSQNINAAEKAKTKRSRSQVGKPSGPMEDDNHYASELKQELRTQGQKDPLYSNNIQMTSYLLSYGDSLLQAEDLRILETNEWINDKIIDFTFEFLTNTKINQSNLQDDILMCCAEVVQLAKLSPGEVLEAILGSLDLPSRKWIFLPINNNESLDQVGGSHWSLLVFDADKKTFYHFDSLHHANYGTACVISASIGPILGFTDQTPPVIKAESPVQQNGYDCGMYVIEIARELVYGIRPGKSLLLEKVPNLDCKQIIDARARWSTVIRNLAEGKTF